ncbi:unnamed protein product [Ascophyllum nodosum]
MFGTTGTAFLLLLVSDIGITCCALYRECNRVERTGNSAAFDRSPWRRLAYQSLPSCLSLHRCAALPRLLHRTRNIIMATSAAGDDQKTEEETPRTLTSSFWFHEFVTEDLEMRSRLDRIMLNAASKFQAIQVVKTSPFGKTLVLDGKTQSAQLDEFIYHESLVHPAMLVHPHPKRVYIGGGGELATAREVLRHKSVEECVMVDLDKLVVDTSREVLPEWGAGVFDDPRLEVHYADAHAYLRENEGMFDVIIMDIADPIEAGPGYVLYTQDFYEFAITRLSPGGVLVTQSGAAGVHLKEECFTVIHKTLASVFKTVAGSVADIPSFGCCWGFNLATDSESFNVKDHLRRNPDTTDEMISSRIEGELRFYDGTAHLGLFGTPKWLRAAIEEEKRIMTVDKPIFMF